MGLTQLVNLVIISALINLAVFARVLAALPSQITLASTHWAPYTSGDSPQQLGIVTEYLTEILAKHQIRLVVERYPWTRAVKLANSEGHIDGLLTAVHAEAPALLFGQVPIMDYKVSFFTHKDSDWSFVDESSLLSMPSPLGLIAGYGYGEPIDSFIDDPEHRQLVHAIKGDQLQLRLLKLLEYRRVAVVIEDELVMQSLHYDKSLIRQAGTLNHSPFYLALKPSLGWSKPLLRLLDQEFASLENQQRLDNIISRYLINAEPTLRESTQP
jgi:polar amino acid transport system substrate-binding protein